MIEREREREKWNCHVQFYPLNKKKFFIYNRRGISRNVQTLIVWSIDFYDFAIFYYIHPLQFPTISIFLIYIIGAEISENRRGNNL